MYVVLDANIVVSALISPRGIPAQVVRRWQTGDFEIAVSLPIVAEIERVIHYPRIRKRYALPEDQVQTFISLLARRVVDRELLPNLSVITDDPSDNRYLECAIAFAARFIVSGDEHLLRLKRYQGVEIVSPAGFLAFLELER
jgi:putative PIN family toxin of toxin-antitoxin system